MEQFTFVKSFKHVAVALMLIKDNQLCYMLSVGKKTLLNNSIRLPTIEGIEDRVTSIIDHATRRPIYVYRSGMDCDGVAYGNPIKYKNINEADESIDKDYEWADGPINFTRICKEEYLESESYLRDLAAEAHENGHPHSLHY